MRVFLGLKKIHSLYRHIRYLLIPLIPLYLLIFYIRRMFSKRKRFKIPIICIGNITTGGTGKTTTVIYVTQLLQENGFKPGVVSRGYGGSESRKGALVTDGKVIYLNPEESGDEPYLIAMRLRDIPVVIGKDRLRAVEYIIGRFNLDVIVMDDGFQNESIYKDLSILLVDATNPFGNNLILPAGDMREPKGSLKRGDLIVISRSDIVSRERIGELYDKVRRLCSNDRIFSSRYADGVIYRVDNPDFRRPADVIAGKSVLLITGIANPTSFMSVVRKYNPRHVDIISLPDHYNYRDSDISDFIKDSQKYDYVIVTEKDFVKLKRYRVNDKFNVMRISVEIDDGDVFSREIIAKITPYIS
jgi:tetraacyldisaccharide 4'-kinase